MKELKDINVSLFELKLLSVCINKARRQAKGERKADYWAFAICARYFFFFSE